LHDTSCHLSTCNEFAKLGYLSDGIKRLRRHACAAALDALHSTEQVRLLVYSAVSGSRREAVLELDSKLVFVSVDP
jgi:hypothetical protein